MTEKRVSVRLAAVGGDKLKAELAAVGREGGKALREIGAAAEPAAQGLSGVGASAGGALASLEALAARASAAAASLRAAGASTGALVERIDQATGVSAGAAPGLRRSAEDVAAYGTALDDLRARHNPLFAVIRDYRGRLADIRQAHAVGALSAEEMQAAIRRERQAALGSIAAIKGRSGALQELGAASGAAAFQSRMLMFQLNDVFVSLASGMSPLMVAVQQGSQIQQIYGDGQGGLRGALRDTGRMIGGVLTRFPPLTAAVAAGSAAILGMRSAINETSNVTVSFGDVALAVWQTMQDGLMRVLRPAIDAIAPWFSAAWRAVVSGAVVAGNAIVNGFRAAFEAVRLTWAALPDILGAATIGAANAALAGVEAIVNGAIALLNGLSDRVNGVLSRIPGLGEDRRIGALEPVAIGRLENPYAERAWAGTAEIGARLSTIMQDDPLGAFFEAVRGRAIANALDETAEAAGRTGGTLRDVGAKAAEGANEAVPAIEKTETLLDRLTASLDDYAARTREMGADVADALTSAFSSAEDAVASFVRTGKLEVGSLVSSMISDLAKLSARRFILGPIANALSGALGSLFGSAAPLTSPLPVPRPVLHGGGLVGASAPMRLVPDAHFAGAPRLHAGGVAGLRPDEVPAILQRGERVLSRAETQRWDRARSASGPAITVHIHTRDAESFRQSRTQVAADIARAVSLGRRGL